MKTFQEYLEEVQYSKQSLRLMDDKDLFNLLKELDDDNEKNKVKDELYNRGFTSKDINK